jgi:DNA-binding transcriptional regulator YhcF (GntR family)
VDHDVPIRVDRTSPVPLYFQVAQHLEQLIESGELASGSRLENETDLADRLGLSRPTMRKAIGYLVDRGLLVRKRGVGTQVVHAKVRRQIELTSLYDDLAKTRRDPSTTVVSFSRRPSGAPALDLGLARGTEVYSFERPLRRRRATGADAQPRPGKPAPPAADGLERRGLCNLSGRHHLRIARQSIAPGPRPRRGPALGESRAAPLLTMERTAYTTTAGPSSTAAIFTGLAVQLRPDADRLVATGPPWVPRRTEPGQA